MKLKRSAFLPDKPALSRKQIAGILRKLLRYQDDLFMARDFGYLDDEEQVASFHTEIGLQVAIDAIRDQLRKARHA